jgi:hypothetical protein
MNEKKSESNEITKTSKPLVQLASNRSSFSPTALKKTGAQSADSSLAANASSTAEPRLNIKSITPMRGPRIRVSKSMELKKNIPKTYYVSKSNGWRLVKDALDKRGWQQLPFEYQFSTRFGLKWVERRSQIDYKSHTPGQLVCHIPNNGRML